MITVSKRQNLINSSVKVAATIGLANTTTKTICTEAKLNEVYLYRNFNNKDHLLLESYLQENQKLMHLIIDEIEDQTQYAETKSLKERSKAVVSKAWNYLTENPNACKFLVYYYQSAQFTEHALTEHNKWANLLLDKLSFELYNEKEYARTLLYVIFNTVFSMAKQVADDRLPNTEETAEMVFKCVYIFISACYKNA
ncbi:MAG: TetR/AcrR family transcriptional regulator [Clostridia bacterium]|nr:TetR/AcrR family transcriptional regulator [Clostridia bacterium]